MSAATTSVRERTRDTLFGLAYGDAVGFPSLFHRFHVLPAKRHDFLFKTNMRQSRNHILPLALPFTHRQAEATLSPKPTDDTEYCVFTLDSLLSGPAEPTLDSILEAWTNRLVDTDDEAWTRFSERAAINNLRAGLGPPQSGNDNPLHYEDAAVSRAIAIGLYFPGEPERAAEVAAAEASISQSEDGIWGAQAMAASIAALVGGEGASAVVTRARGYFPQGSWISVEMEKAQNAAERSDRSHELALLLAEEVINNVYSFGNAAPETVPAALTMFAEFGDDILACVGAANLIAKSADSLPAMVGALCGAAGNGHLIGKTWADRLDLCHGICLPSVKGLRLSQMVERLAAQGRLKD